MSTAASTIRHALGVGFEAIVILGIVAALAFGLALANGHPAGAGSVFAAKGGNGGGGGASGGGSSGGYSISVVTNIGLAPTDLTYGSTVTTYSAYGDADPAYARVLCTANTSTVTSLATGATVYDVFLAVRQGTWDTGGYSSFDTTMSGGWTGGGADCTASLLTYTMHNANRVWKTLASTAFSVMP